MIKPHFYGPVILIAGLIFGIAETWFFGWNLLPINIIEFLCDLCTMFIVSVGSFLSVASIINRLIRL